jgi:hypothetical protein
LSTADAQQRHGPEGTGCWDATRCHQRRSYYRHRDRYNSNRRQNRQAQEDNIEVVPVPSVPAAVLYLYRQRVDAPIHAVGAELWLGQEKKAAIAPVHCFGLTAGQIATYLQQVLQVFSQKYGNGKRLDKFTSQIELDPQTCLIRPCPLHPQ